MGDTDSGNRISTPIILAQNFPFFNKTSKYLILKIEGFVGTSPFCEGMEQCVLRDKLS
jgi:hypothetical protein